MSEQPKPKLLGQLVEPVIGEWNKRTRFGKLLFPVWLILTAGELLTLLTLFGFVILARKILYPSGSRGSILPNIYRGESE